MKKLLPALSSLTALMISVKAPKAAPAQEQHGALGKAATGAAPLSLGKKAFIARCSARHGDDASKELPDGTSLIQRLEGNGDFPAALAGRSRKLPKDEQHAVLFCVTDQVKHFRSRNSIGNGPGE